MEAAKETVNSLLTTASKMVYGDTTETDTTSTTNTTGNKGSLVGDDTTSSTGNTTGGIEPVSGQSGPGTADKPHDAGNTTGEPTNTTGSSTSSSDPTDTTGKSSATATTAQDVGSAPPESGAAPTTKQQGADKPSDAPDSTETEAITNKKNAAENAMDDEKNAAGGNSSGATAGGSSGATDDAAAGGDSAGSSGATSDTPGPKPLSSKSGSGGGDGGQDDALGSKSEEKGTGEKYIKSSGVQAEGGDFDAANAGAGREADRLLEEKGIHREGGNTGPPQEVPGDKGASSSADAGDKVSFGQKIKDKLHIGNKDKP